VRAVDLIQRKRDGGELSQEEIDFFIKGYARGQIPDYQAAALAMAVLFRGMSPAELSALTGSMMRSGRVLDLSDLPAPKADKHSTGGVGDKTSLVLAPLVAACGVYVPMISGRGLGHTGGTLDKLESIPGFRVELGLGEFRSVLERCGLALIGATPEIAPADRKLYALRDVTATIESLPLIAASIMSKKMAEGIDALVLDVKAGNGAFVRDLDQARELARAMIGIGREMGRKVEALVTRMDQPLGRTVGNSLEVGEAIATLKGRGPRDLESLSIELAARMVHLSAGIALDVARGRVRGALASGAGLEKLRQVVELQGGDPRVCDDPSLLPQSPHTVVVRADRDGRVGRLEARGIGHAAMLLGAGREVIEGTIDAGVGFLLHKKVGDPVAVNEPIVTVYHAGAPERLERALAALQPSIEVGRQPPRTNPLVLDRLA
jgi:pyrimidine-nucleoside phosphorylase/thymidine phosphorylase